MAEIVDTENHKHNKAHRIQSGFPAEFQQWGYATMPLNPIHKRRNCPLHYLRQQAQSAKREAVKAFRGAPSAPQRSMTDHLKVPLTHP